MDSQSHDMPHPPVVPGADGTFVLPLVIQAVLVEGVFTEEVNSRQGETPFTQTALHHLEDLSTTGGERNQAQISLTPHKDGEGEANPLKYR